MSINVTSGVALFRDVMIGIAIVAVLLLLVYALLGQAYNVPGASAVKTQLDNIIGNLTSVSSNTIALSILIILASIIIPVLVMFGVRFGG
ncbi:MAG: hypothetical protein C0179_05785 [Fervidicoccus sp.]|nr:MAG: hypothetical protein C0179_05785 [Fervidicoccus sp.]